MGDNGSIASALYQTAEQFHILVDSVEEYAIYILDPNGNVVTWNTGAQKIKGYTAEEIIGKNFACFYTAEDVAADKPQPGEDTFVIRACASAKMDQLLKPKLY